MRICMICPEIGNAGENAFIGGPTNNVVRLSKALSRRGHEISIVTTPHRYPGNETNNSLEWAEVFCLSISGSFSSFRSGFEFATKAALKIRKLDASKEFDIIHGHSGYTMPALITGISAKISDVPAVHSIYAPVLPMITRNAVRLFSNKILSRFYISKVDRIVAISNNVANSLINSGILKRKIKVIPPGVDTSFFNPSVSQKDIRREFNIPSDYPVLLYVGSLTKIKGIHILIDALSEVKEQYPEVKLLLVLNMPLSTYRRPNKIDLDMVLLQRIKKEIESYGLEDNVIPIGLTNKMPQIMSASDISIVPFLSMVGVADYPLSLLEAMAVGKPIIATRVGGIPEIIKHNENGMLVEPNNIDELVAAILHMLNNKEEAKTMGKEGAKLISEKFISEIEVDKLERIYEEVTSNYSGNRRH